jgi:hypothetical protein
MKKTYILILFAICVSNAIGQVTLTARNNSPLPGDSSGTSDINYINPGNAGENQVWDFSGIQYTGKKTFCGVQEDLTYKMTGSNEKGLILKEEGYEYQYTTGENKYEETGYSNPSRKLTLSYSDPVVKMSYPFSYGQQFSDRFTGVGWYSEKSRIDLNGVYTVTADAFGTLILPGRILKNTLRVEAVRESLQVNTCGSTQSHVVKYYWFAPGYRYPVMMVSTTTNKTGMREPVVVQHAWVNLNQQPAGAFATGVVSGEETEAGGNDVVVYPNPFSEQLSYSYMLQKQVPVMVELYDMSGKFNLKVEKKQVQPEGLHTGNINATIMGLTPGVYYLRFTLDKQVVVSKIVKI